MPRDARPYSDPYLAGVGIGAVLLAAYVVVGRGLGASGAFASVVAGDFLSDWLVLELAGVIVGGALSAWSAGRLRRTVERGAGLAPGHRVLAAVAGGVLMGVGARLARGCTSGQALTGGALLSAGSWIFIVTCFAAGYACAPFARRLWRIAR